MTKSANKIFSAPHWRWAGRLLLLLVLAVFAYQFYRIGGELDWAAFAAALGRPGQWKFLLAAALLMPLNWLLEARKWQLLLQPFLPWTFVRTLRTTLAGVSLSAATPNRIGEIGGRLLVARRGEYGGVLTSSVLGSACQWIAFLLLGWPALIWTAGDLIAGRLPFGVHWLWPVGPLVIALGLIAGKRPLRWGIERLGRWLGGGSETLSAGLEHVKLSLIARAGGYACARYGVYCLQLVLLLRFFGLALPWGEGLAGVAAIYLVQAGLPLPPGVNLVTRTELGLLLWQDSPSAAVATLMAFTSLFALNVLLPALPGYWFLLRRRSAPSADPQVTPTR